MKCLDVSHMFRHVWRFHIFWDMSRGVTYFGTFLEMSHYSGHILQCDSVGTRVEVSHMLGHDLMCHICWDTSDMSHTLDHFKTFHILVHVLR